MRGGTLQQVTQDHSVVANLVAAGLAQPEEVYNHERKNVIYRSLGDKPELKIDTFAFTLQPGDRLLLCCDGLWEMVHDSLIEDTLLQYPEHPQPACEALIKLANSAGGDDNISAIIIDVLACYPQEAT
jgi:serine/threonine protein phosphatase PrpC